jgi:hypothetical protein
VAVAGRGVRKTSNNDNHNVRSHSSTLLVFSAAANNSIPPSSSSSFGSNDPPKQQKTKKVLTEADVLARSKQLQTGPFQGGSDEGGVEAVVPKLFTPQIYNDIQTSLLLLEQRVKNGRRGLDVVDINKLINCTDAIIEEMLDYLADPSGCNDRIAKVYAGNGGDATTAAAAKTTTVATSVMMTSTTTPVDTNTPQIYVPPPPRKGEPGAGKYRQQQQSTIPTTLSSSSLPLSISTRSNNIIDTTTTSSSATTNAANTVNDDDTLYDKNNDNDKNNQDADTDNINFGLARGTTNTYIIPNMESMSPSEYQQQLQATISARQVRDRERVLYISWLLLLLL